jgi:thiamine pyrophosphokinase
MLKSILNRDAEGIIANEHNEIYLIDRKTELKREPGLKVTLLSLTEKTEGVTTKGLYYPLTDATLSFGSSWGVSNEFSSETAEISLKKGLLLVIKSRD